MKTRYFLHLAAILLFVAAVISCSTRIIKYTPTLDKLYGPNGSLIKTTEVNPKSGLIMAEYYHQEGEQRSFGYTNTDRGWVQTSIILYKDIYPDDILTYTKTHKIVMNERGGVKYVEQYNKVLGVVAIDKLPEIDTTNISEHRMDIVEALTEGKKKIKQEFVSDVQAFKKKHLDKELELTEEAFSGCLKILNKEILRLEKEIENLRNDLMQVDFTVDKTGKFYNIGILGDSVFVLQMNNYVKEVRYSPWTSKKISEKTFKKGRLADETYLFDEKGNKHLFAKYNYNERDTLLFVDVFDRVGSVIKRIYGMEFSPYIMIKGQDDTWIKWPEPINEAAEKLDILLGHRESACGYSSILIKLK